MIRPTCLALMLFTAALPAQANDGVLDVVAPFELKGPDPIQSGNIFLKMDVVETLIDADAEGRLRPALATAWEVTPDGLTWRLDLREGVRFHDGTPMDGAAVATALNRALQNGGLLARAPVAEIRAAGAHRLEIRLESPFAMLPAMLAEYRSAIVAPSAIAADGSITALIGTGAYRVRELAPPNTLAVEAFDGYWGAPPAIPKAVYTAASRAETRALMAESGDADVTINLDPASVSRLRMADGLDVLSVAIPRVLMLKVNGARYDADMRRALSLAIDRDGIARAVLRYPAGATQMFPPGMAGWHDSSLAPLAYDPAAARAALAALGWQAGPDGILERQGEKLEIEILTYPDRPELPLVAAVLEQAFAAIGARATINATNYTEIPTRHNDGTLDTALFARNFALVPDPVGTLLQDYAPGGDWGAMGWSNPAFTEGVRAMAEGVAPDGTRASLVATMQAELPVLPIAWYQQTMAVSKGITGVVLDPFERTLGLKSVEWAE
ncbi:ABC transporter substrate-binding protein [Phaeovulum vinaykumarii]|uniref:Peptide/nickel transport system substrate-binding protein n=1 Tax=Phaeovulum vinaykumarii TaxID=407234 RepID=A0A1N7M0H6_9RHOB|nr:ABC transporter substrate-binding protein [Phaeovulum vinaykumarii]SIS79562.1 peptide/nickel transport system substrate-binding protein [Phaeovulum vinaykumarii]SOC09707.1 peptide/nickel transport system substrate-binding protein [Phaeovulum vinaykumarii]